MLYEKMSEVDGDGTEPLAGQARIHEKEIRLFDHPSAEDTLHTMMHEVLHVLGEEFGLEQLQGEENHKFLDVLALLLTIFLTQNEVLKL